MKKELKTKNCYFNLTENRVSTLNNDSDNLEKDFDYTYTYTYTYTYSYNHNSMKKFPSKTNSNIGN